MQRKLSSCVAALALFWSTACYHAIVETGRPAGTTVVSKPWVATWIFGLVPAQEISVAAECPNGIARVETQQTFVNGLRQPASASAATNRRIDGRRMWLHPAPARRRPQPPGARAGADAAAEVEQAHADHQADDHEQRVVHGKDPPVRGWAGRRALFQS